VLRILGAYPDEIRDLLTDPEVDASLRSVLNHGGKVDLTSRSLDIRMPGKHLMQAKKHLEQATGMVHALERAGTGVWAQLASECGLAWDPKTTTMRGSIDGVRLESSLSTKPKRETTITAWFSPSLPQGTRIRHIALGADHKLGDPILDGMVSVRTTEPEQLAERIANDKVRGLLLEVVHGYQGSVVDVDSIILKAPGRLLKSLPTALQSVVELSKALH